MSGNDDNMQVTLYHLLEKLQERAVKYPDELATDRLFVMKQLSDCVKTAKLEVAKEILDCVKAKSTYDRHYGTYTISQGFIHGFGEKYGVE